MSIQRYGFDAFGHAHPGGVIIHADDGPYVTYEDARRWVAEAVAEARADMVDATRWRQGAALFMTSRDIDRVCRLAAAEERARIRKAIEALPTALNCWDRYGAHLDRTAVLAVIDNEESK